MNRRGDWAAGRWDNFEQYPSVSQSPCRPVALAQILFFDGDQFCDALTVTRGAFGGRKPDADDFAHLFHRDHASAERQHIGVVVLPAVRSEEHTSELQSL